MTEARQGDLTVQHGGGGRLGPWVAAATAAPGPCGKHLLPPPPPVSLLGQGRSQVRGVEFRGGPGGWRSAFHLLRKGVLETTELTAGATHDTGENRRAGGTTVLLH